MSQRDWEKVWELFQIARDADSNEREKLLAESGAEPEVLFEVSGLLADELAQARTPEPGHRYGRYTLVARLGRGGMGEVFSARDGELGRMVAIKFLNGRSEVLPAAVELLVREAQTASALNHPNLVTVHEILRYDAGVAVVQELVSGEALRAFCGAPVPIAQAAAWGAQMARGLAAAHAESIVHGDIKPENIMLREDGYIKILDFGLARRHAESGDVASLPLGTVGYMSPEQTRGEKLAPASDIFSLGVVLLELISARHPFLEISVSQTTLAINHREVEIPFPALDAARQMSGMLRAMLHKNPAHRPAALEVAATLERIASPRRFRRAGWWVAGAAALALVAFWMARPHALAVVHFGQPVALTDYYGIEKQPALSPDGKRLAFVWSGDTGDQDDVYVRSIDGGDVRRVTDDPRPKFSPVWSRDGLTLAWESRARDGSPTWIMIAPAAGSTIGPPRRVGEVVDHEGFWGIAWLPDASGIVVRDQGAAGYGLVRMSIADGSKSAMTRDSDANDMHPMLSPDGRRLLFVRTSKPRHFLCRLELSPGARESCVEVNAVSTASWLPDSKAVVFSSGQALFQLNMVTGPAARPVRLLDGKFDDLRLSDDGTRLVFSRTITDMNIWRLDLTTHKASQFAASSAEDSEPQFSPDGKHVVFRSLRTGAYELYLCGQDASGLRKLTSLGGHLGSAAWSPDGKWIVFDSEPAPNSSALRNTALDLIPAEGGEVRRLTNDDVEYSLPGWSSDSRWIYYRRGQERHTWKLPLGGGTGVEVADHQMFDIREESGWLWYERPDQGRGIWRRRVEGGHEVRIAGTENAAYRFWDVRGNTVYVLLDGPRRGFAMIRVEEGTNSKVVPIEGAPPKRLFIGTRNLTASPDGKCLLYTAEDLVMGDIFQMVLNLGT